MRHAVHVLAFLCAFCAGRVDAAVSYLVTNASATFATYALCAAQNACKPVAMVAGTTGGPAANVTFQVVVTNGGACTAQPIGSNDGTNWVNQGSAIAVTTGSVTGGAAINATWAFWSALVTTLTGTGATCTVTVSG